MQRTVGKEKKTQENGEKRNYGTGTHGNEKDGAIEQ